MSRRMAVLFFALGFLTRYACAYAYEAGEQRAGPMRKRLDSAEARIAQLQREDAVLYEGVERLRLAVNEVGIVH